MQFILKEEKEVDDLFSVIFGAFALNRIKFVSLKSLHILISLMVLWSQSAFANPEIECSIPNSVVCEVSDASGIRAVIVQLETGFGTFDVVDARFPSCPDETTVSWDPIVPNFDITVKNCEIEDIFGEPDRASQISVFLSREGDLETPMKLTPAKLGSVEHTRKLVEFIGDEPFLGIEKPANGEPVGILVGCGHKNVFCGAEACLVQSAEEQASCPGNVEDNNLLGTVCVASC